MAVSTNALGSATLKNIYAPLPYVTRGKSYHFGSDPKGKNFLYTCGNSVFIRNLTNPLECEIYSEHVQQPTVAKYAPSGFYIASGDAAGTVRIWDTTQKEHILKIELKIISGPITDIAWSDDSKRLCVVGEGKERFGAVVMWDTGSSVGEISGHSKFITSCDFKQTRPYRIATASEDTQIGWFEGPPFKFKFSLKEHNKFVNCVRFSPDGNKYVSVGSDKMGFLYDAKSGELVTKLNPSDGHSMGVYSASWSPDSKFVVTASADKTLKIWDADKGECVKTLVIDNATNDQQQLAVLWQGKDIISCAVNGEIYYWDPESTSPKKILRGHNKSVTALSYDAADNKLYTAAYDGQIVCWDFKTGENCLLKGKGHTNSVKKLAIANSELYSVGMDDSVRISSLKGLEFGSPISTEVAPNDLSVSAKGSGIVAVATNESILLIKKDKVTAKLAIKYGPTSIAISPDESIIAVGGKDQLIHIYGVGSGGSSINDKNITLKQHRGTITALAFHADGQLLAAGDSNREVIVWDVSKQAVKAEGWVFHTAGINCVSWSPDGDHLVTGAVDGYLYIWSLSTPSKRLAIKDAHKGGVATAIFIDKSTIASGGGDCAVKTWSITYQ